MIQVHQPAGCHRGCGCQMPQPASQPTCKRMHLRVNGCQRYRACQSFPIVTNLLRALISMPCLVVMPAIHPPVCVQMYTIVPDSKLQLTLSGHCSSNKLQCCRLGRGYWSPLTSDVRSRLPASLQTDCMTVAADNCMYYSCQAVHAKCGEAHSLFLKLFAVRVHHANTTQ
jgi:hypothetical protein